MDDERLKQGKTAFGKDYFRELLERVRTQIISSDFDKEIKKLTEMN